MTSALGKSCLRWAIVYFAIAGLTAVMVYLRFPRAGVAAGIGAVGGGLIWMAVGYAVGVGTQGGERKLIEKAMEGGRPEDGEQVAVVGTLAGFGEFLESPISRRRCLLYEYKLEAENEFAIAEGFALTGTRIDGPRGSIRLLAYPELKFNDEVRTSPQDYDNARQYVERTAFASHEGVELKREITHLRSLLADDDGKIRYDIRRAALGDIGKYQLKEKVLVPGDPVVAIGRFSSARGGLVPDPKAILHAVKLMRGTPEEATRNVAGGRGLNATLGLGCLLPVLIAAAAALLYVPLSAIEQMVPEKDPSWAEVRLEQFLERKARTMAAQKFGLTFDEPAIMLSGREARGKLSAGGETSSIDSAVLLGDSGTGEVLLSPANVRLRFRDRKLESIQLEGGAAITSPDADVEQLSITDEEIRARVTYLSETVKLRATFVAR